MNNLSPEAEARAYMSDPRHVKTAMKLIPKLIRHCKRLQRREKVKKALRRIWRILRVPFQRDSNGD